MLAEEFRPVTTFYCPSNPMITDPDSGIIKQIACGLPTGAQALQYLSLPPASLPGLSALAAISPVLLALANANADEDAANGTLDTGTV